MSIQKPSNRVLEQLKKQELNIQKEIGKCDVIEKGIKTLFWKEVSEKLEAKLDRINIEIDMQLKSLVIGNEKKLIDLNARKEEIEGFLSVKDYVKAKEKFKEMLYKKQDEIEEYEEKLAR